MALKTLLGNSLATLFANKRRSLVTILSLAWAVASFLVLMSYGRGFDVALLQAFRSIGQDIVFMTNGQTSLQAGGMRSGRRIRLEKSDINAIKETVPYVSVISPEIMHDATIVRGRVEKGYMLRAVWPEYQEIRNIRMQSGRWLNDDDNKLGRRVAVIGATVSRELFGSRPVVEEEVTVDGVRFTIIGQLETKVQLANYNRPDNECLFIPYESVSTFQNTRYPDDIVWSPVTPGVRSKAVQQVRALLAGRHRFSPADEKAVMIMEFSKFLSIITGMSLALNLLLIFIGTVTLAIGAVGLANIMFSSVIERTREIGVLKALGARRRTILFQFLLESVFIILLGGATGVFIGVVIAQSIGSLPFVGAMLGGELSEQYGRIHFHVSTASILISVGVLFLVGLVAGMLPAFRASRMDPVEALRYE